MPLTPLVTLRRMKTQLLHTHGSLEDRPTAGEAGKERLSRLRFLKGSGAASFGVVSLSLVAPRIARASGSHRPAPGHGAGPCR